MTMILAHYDCEHVSRMAEITRAAYMNTTSMYTTPRLLKLRIRYELYEYTSMPVHSVLQCNVLTRDGCGPTKFIRRVVNKIPVTTGLTSYRGCSLYPDIVILYTDGYSSDEQILQPSYSFDTDIITRRPELSCTTFWFPPSWTLLTNCFLITLRGQGTHYFCNVILLIVVTRFLSFFFISQGKNSFLFALENIYFSEFTDICLFGNEYLNFCIKLSANY